MRSPKYTNLTQDLGEAFICPYPCPAFHPRYQTIGKHFLNMPQNEYDAIVVGAGFGGIYSLYSLMEKGLDVRVIEAGGDVSICD